MADERIDEDLAGAMGRAEDGGGGRAVEQGAGRQSLCRTRSLENSRGAWPSARPDRKDRFNRHRHAPLSP